MLNYAQKYLHNICVPFEEACCLRQTSCIIKSCARTRHIYLIKLNKYDFCNIRVSLHADVHALCVRGDGKEYELI